MHRVFLKSKIHRARVTETDTEYEGSITIDRSLLGAADLAVYEKVQIVNITNGERFETYTIEGEPGEICLNGAAARLAEVGDRVIIMAYASYPENESPDPTIIRLDETNSIIGSAGHRSHDSIAHGNELH